MSASLLAIVEVNPSDRIRCQAPGCFKSVYKRIHVVGDGDRIVAVGSDCWARVYAHGPATNVTPRYGDSRGRLLTPQERALLLENTAAFIARMEQEVAHAESERRRSAPREVPGWRAPPFEPDYPPYVAPKDDRRRDQDARDKLKKYREQQALRVARDLIARVPAFQRFPERWIARAMVKAKEDCIARGMKLDEAGSRQRIEAGALELLERHYRP